MKEGQISTGISISEAYRDPEDVESIPSRTDSSSSILEDFRLPLSQSYPQEPSPLRFTHLNSPIPDAYFMPSPSLAKPHRRRKLFSRSCGCCCLCSVLVTAGVLLGLAALITWLVLRPVHAPRYSLENLELKTLRLNDPPNTDVSFIIRVTIAAENSNRRLGFKYDAIEIATSYRGHVFGHSAVSPFSQGHRNVTTVTSEFVVENYAFSSASLGSDFAADVKLASVALHVRASAKVRVKVGVVTSFALKVFVDCDFVVKPPTDTAPSSVINKTCKLTR